VRFEISRQWDGTPARPRERTVPELSRERSHWLLDVEAPFHADAPPTGGAGPTPGLWNHEAVELFLLAPPDHYLEIELGPFGHHWVLELRGERHAVREGLPLDFEATRDAHRWSGRARIPSDWIPPGTSHANAYAIHGAGPERRCLAWAAVPGREPDFHRLERFRELPAGTFE